MKRRGWTLLLVSLITCTAIGMVIWGSAKGASGRTSLLGRSSSGNASGGTTIPHFHSGLEALPRSLQGSHVDGSLRVDGAGHLVVDRQVRSVFDYFLAAVGEESLPVIVARLHAYIHSQLPALAAAEADTLLGQYIAYKQALAQLPPPTPASAGQPVDVAALELRLSQIQGLRRQYLPPAAVQAFFAEEDAYAEFSLQRVRILQDATLSAQAKAAELAAAEGQLPSDLQQSLHAEEQVQALQSLTQQWRQSGGTPAQLRQIRETLVGAAAADRLEALDAQRAQFAGRFHAYMQQRSAILTNKSLSADEQQNALDQLMSSQFSAQERTRVQALQQDPQALPAG